VSHNLSATLTALPKSALAGAALAEAASAEAALDSVVGLASTVDLAFIVDSDLAPSGSTADSDVDSDSTVDSDSIVDSDVDSDSIVDSVVGLVSTVDSDADGSCSPFPSIGRLLNNMLLTSSLSMVSSNITAGGVTAPHRSPLARPATAPKPPAPADGV
jgi:hypothetical protein